MDAIVSLPILQELLLVIMFLAILVEIKTGGMGAGILLGLVAAAVFWGTQYTEGLVDLFPIAMFLGGVLCLIIEILMPTIGLLAGVGIALMLYSVVLAMGGDLNAVYAILISLVIAIGLFALVVKKLPSSTLWERFTLKNRSQTSAGFTSAADHSALLGKTGVVLTKLRPSGSIEVEGKPVDVVSEGEFLDKGVKVKVVEVEGSRIVVRRCED